MYACVFIASVFGTHVIVVTLNVRVAAARDWRKSALIRVEITNIGSTCITVVAVGVTGTAVLDCVIVTVTGGAVGRSKHTLISCAHVIIVAVAILLTARFDLHMLTAMVTTTRVQSAWLRVATIGVIMTAVIDGRAYTLMSSDVAVLECAQFIVIALGVARAAVVDFQVSTLTSLYVARVQCTEVRVVAVTVLFTASRDRCALATVSGKVTRVVGAHVRVGTVCITGTTVNNRGIDTLMSHTLVFGAYISVVAFVIRNTTPVDVSMSAKVIHTRVGSAYVTVATVAHIDTTIQNRCEHTAIVLSTMVLGAEESVFAVCIH